MDYFVLSSKIMQKYFSEIFARFQEFSVENLEQSVLALFCH